jgi:hypothetical protein
MPQKDFDALKKIAGRGVKFTEIAYNRTNLTNEEIKSKIQGSNPDKEINHELLFYSNETESDQFEYRCAVFIDHEKKEVVFANAGTRLDLNEKGLYDLADDARLLINIEPAKLEPARKINAQVLAALGDNVVDYNFSYTGHSLGAAIADMQAAAMDIELQKLGLEVKGITTTTFDNPGAGLLVDKMYKEAEKPQNVDFNAFNNRDNFINTFAPQAGNLYKIKPDDQRDLSIREQLTALVANFISKQLKGWAPDFIIKVCEVVSFGSVKTQIKGHELSNFEKVLSEGKGIVEMHKLKLDASSPTGETIKQTLKSKEPKTQSLQI